MCDFSKGFKLCSCEREKIQFRTGDVYRKTKGGLKKVPNKKNDQIPLIYIWRLARFAGKTDEYEIGRYLLPSDDLGNGLNADWIVLNLNCGNCFDFDYLPDEGDRLTISQNVILGPYISFIYREKEWKADHYDPFMFETEEKAMGKVDSL